MARGWGTLGQERGCFPGSRLLALQRCFLHADKELKRTGVTHLPGGRREEFPDDFQYSQFCFYFNQWKARVNPVMNLDHKAGGKLNVDFAGERLWLADRESGEPT